MKKNSVMVKSVLMSMITAGAFVFGFSSCSKDDVLLLDDMEDPNQEIVAGENDSIKTPLGLVFKDFVNEGDVQILDADTTTIAVSKAYAEKLGVDNFVSHPMGIWQAKNERAYLRRPTAQKLVGDKYILKVVPADLGEVLAGQNLELNTSIYVNPNAGAATRGAAGMVDKYTDQNGVIHPAAITMTRRAGEAVTRGGFSTYGTLSPEEILAGESFQLPATRGFIDDAAECIVRFIKSGGHFTGNGQGRIMQLEGTITPPKIHIKTGDNEGDTVTINSKVPYNVELNYTLKVDTWVKPKLSINPLNMLEIDTRYFEGRLDGKCSMAPQMTLGISGEAELPKDKQDYPLCDLAEFHFTFFAGPVPIDICLQPNLSAHVNAGVKGSVYTGIKYEYASEFSAGIKYENKKWQPIANHEVKKNEFNFITPRGTFHAEAEIGIMLGCDVLVNLLAGPTASFGPMLKGELDAVLAPMEKTPFTFDANVTLGLMGKAGAKVKLWKIELFDWEFDLKFGPQWDIWSFSYPFDDNNSNKGGNDKLTKQVEEVAQQIVNGENEKYWNQFVEMVKNDREVQEVKRQLGSDYYCQGILITADRQYNRALTATHNYMLDFENNISPDKFKFMKKYLINVLWGYINQRYGKNMRMDL